MFIAGKARIVAAALIAFVVIGAGISFSGLSRTPGPESLLPPELTVASVVENGSTWLGDRRCGAVVYRLADPVALRILESGLRALPDGLHPRVGAPYGRWQATPMSDDLFRRYIFNKKRPAAAWCGGVMRKGWPEAARQAGNFYAENGESLILVRVENNSVTAGYFHDR